ncbi:MAG: CpXC domain-containing protein, partial [Microvirga sp.]
MSIFQTAQLTCPDCGARTEVQRCASVNADRRQDLRTAILDGTFQTAACSGCGARLRLPPHFTYLEVGRKLWIAAEPASEIETWPAIEAHVFQVYDRSFGLGAAPIAQELADGLLPRLVFGWAALREKLVCDELGLDDVTLELLKMSVVRSVDGSPMADGSELRLIGGDAGTLNLQWVVAETEATLAALSVPRGVYDAIAADPAPWAAARAV